MDCKKIGRLIDTMRTEQHMTQKQLAEKLRISDKTVSKWERGQGCPDISLLQEIARLFDVTLESLLLGELDTNDTTGGSMKKVLFYSCPQCGNVITSALPAEVYCCGKKVSALSAVKAEDTEKLSIETMDDSYFISTNHEMTKEHYISFVAFVTGDSMMLKKTYPEWDLQVHIPQIGHGKLLWYCTQHGLFYQLL